MTDHYSADDRHKISTALAQYLADTTIVYFKTHTYHWNVEGEAFYSLHLMFEKFYKELWESMDEVAERIRIFSVRTPANFATLLPMATIHESEASPSSQTMIQNLRKDYLALAQKALDVGAIADEHGDRITTDMMTAKATFLEKAAWMLQSSLKS